MNAAATRTASDIAMDRILNESMSGANRLLIEGKLSDAPAPDGTFAYRQNPDLLLAGGPLDAPEFLPQGGMRWLFGGMGIVIIRGETDWIDCQGRYRG